MVLLVVITLDDGMYEDEQGKRLVASKEILCFVTGFSLSVCSLREIAYEIAHGILTRS